jgi:putative membrane protein
MGELMKSILRRCAVACAAVALTAGGALTASAGGTALNAQDKAYLIGAHQTNLAEIATGKLAESKSDSGEIKDLGAMLVADHTKLDTNLRKVAAAANVSLPTAPNAEQRALGAKLAAASANEFDPLFVSGQLTGHTKAMALGKQELSAGSDPAVKKDARAAAPVIAKHHDMFMAQAESMNLPTGVDAGLSTRAGDTNALPVALLAFGTALVAAGVVFTVRRQVRG